MSATGTPAWSKALPTQSGWYWCRPTEHRLRPFVAYVSWATADMGGPLVTHGLRSHPADLYAGCEWWPVRIEEPPQC